MEDFNAFLKQTFSAELKRQFPGQSLDPDQTYVNEIGPNSGHVIESRPLTEVALIAIQQGASPTYDLGRFGLYRSSGAADSDRIGGHEALIKLEKAIDATRNGIEQKYRIHVMQSQYPSASPTELSRLKEYETLRADDGAAMERQLGALATRQGYAASRIRDYVQEQTGSLIDPDQIKVRATFATAPAVTSRDQTLTELALQGPFAEGVTFRLTPPPPGAAAPSSEVTAALTPEVLKTMLNQLDVNSGYVDALRQQFNSAETANALIDAIDSRAQHAAYSARLTRKLSADDYQLIQSVRAVSGNEDPSSASQLGGLTLLVDNKLNVRDQLKDILIYHDATPGNQRFVMYAPGAPDKEFYSANSEDGLSRVVHNWTKTDVGRRYLANQLDPDNRQKGLAFFEKGLGWKLPSEGDGTPTVNWKEFSGVPYLARLGDAAAERGRAQVAEAEAAVRPSWYANASADERKQFDLLNVAAKAATENYQREVNPQSFREYAHKLVQDSVNARLKVRGTNLQVDPDKVEVEVDGKWRTLTDVVTYGYRESSGFNFAQLAKFRATDGQDVSALNDPKTREGQLMRGDIDALARRLYVGSQYINETRGAILSVRTGQRRDLHQTATAAMMRRDALEAKLNRHLTSGQYKAVAALIDQWGERDNASARDIAAGTAPGFYQFKLNDKDVRGVYALRTANSVNSQLDELVYTPGGPDGKTFRSRDEIKASLAKFAAHPYREMLDYFTQRMSYDDRKVPAIRDLAWEIEHKEKPGIRTDTSQRIMGKTHLEFDRSVQLLIDDVDATTKSRGEVIGDLAWDGINYAVMAVTLPYGLAAGLPALTRLAQLPKLAGQVANGFKAFPWHLPYQTISAATGGGTAGKSFADGVSAMQDGDRAAALEHFVSGVLDFAGAAGDILDASKGFKKLTGRVKPLTTVATGEPNAASSSAAASNVGNAATAQTSTIRSSFHTPLPSGTQTIWTDGYMKDVVQIQPHDAPSSRYFVRDGNGYFEVAPDKDNQTLRLVDPRKGNRQMYFEPIRKNAQGQWVRNNLIGHHGGTRNSIELNRLSREDWGNIPNNDRPVNYQDIVYDDFDEGVYSYTKKDGSKIYTYKQDGEYYDFDNNAWSPPERYEYSKIKTWKSSEADDQYYQIEYFIEGVGNIEDWKLNRAREGFKSGQYIPPILVKSMPSGKFRVIDGHNRLQVARELGMTRIPYVLESSVTSSGLTLRTWGHTPIYYETKTNLPGHGGQAAVSLRGYTDNYRGKGEPAILTHGGYRVIDGGMLYYARGTKITDFSPPNGPVVTQQFNSEAFVQPDEFVRLMRIEHGIDLRAGGNTGNGPLRLIACFASKGGADSAAQKLANATGRRVYAYSDLPVRAPDISAFDGNPSANVYGMHTGARKYLIQARNFIMGRRGVDLDKLNKKVFNP
ncbi:TPA: ParB N-terminal domain-containing protein [Burkholderia cepacia]|uniref:ParB/Srx family N-terminal domain-containing protein n=1 Tax=Burkholderia cepacia TaxID=292 RepID=UPI0015E2F255|nr:ParB/Srx family N-terminal domain-containing protein [Burkholderia cepacia]HDR9512172.1 ParB N-terminal domain-containing protein [Burkholderia cepacia]